MSTVFLVMFLVGFGLTAISALLGALHSGGDAGHDFGHGHAHGGGIDVGHGHGDLAHGDLAHGHGDASPADRAAAVSPVNFQTIVAFLMGFGGVGYLVERLGLIGLILMIPLALVGGLTCAWLIYRFLRLMVKGERQLPPTSYVGVVGKLTMPIREGGTGEMVYAQNDVRQVTAARSHDGKPIARDEDVVILRHDRGVAYVQRWREFMDQAEK